MKTKMTESTVAKGARQARRNSLSHLLDITIRAVLNDAVETNRDELEEQAKALAKQLSDRKEMERAFLRTHGNEESNPRQTLAAFGRFADDVERRYETLKKGPDESDIKTDKASARRTIDDAIERTMGDNRVSTKTSDLGTMPHGIFTEPISLTPPGNPPIPLTNWTILWQQAVASAMDRNPSTHLPLTGHQGKTLVSRDSDGSLTTTRAANANGALNMTREMLLLVGEDPSKWMLQYRNKRRTNRTRNGKHTKPEQRPLMGDKPPTKQTYAPYVMPT